MSDILFEQSFPYNLEAEQAVLAAILLEPRGIFTAAEVLQPDDFYLQSHRVIFGQLQEMLVDSTAIDTLVLVEDLRKNGKLEAAGGPAKVAGLTDGIARAIALPHYCRIVTEKSKLRKLIKRAERLKNEAALPQADVTKLITEATTDLFALDSQSRTFRHFSDLAAEGYGRLEERSRLKSIPGAIRTGLQVLDSIAGGLSPGDLVLIAARPSQGKSALCAGIAIETALYQGKCVGILSLEMSQGQVYDRALAYESKIDLFRLTNGQLNKDDWQKISDDSSRLSACKIWVDDSSGLNVRQVQARAERLKLERQMELLVVDYLGLMRGTVKGQTKVQEVSEISAGLKTIAKSLKIPVLAACQLNRASEERTSGEPCLADLRDSGSLEQDADQVILIHRPRGQDGNLCVRCELIVAKNRNGRTGRADVLFHRQWTRFVDAIRE